MEMVAQNVEIHVFVEIASVCASSLFCKMLIAGMMPLDVVMYITKCVAYPLLLPVPQEVGDTMASHVVPAVVLNVVVKMKRRMAVMKRRPNSRRWTECSLRFLGLAERPAAGRAGLEMRIVRYVSFNGYLLNIINEGLWFDRTSSGRRPDGVQTSLR